MIKPTWLDSFDIIAEVILTMIHASHDTLLWPTEVRNVNMFLHVGRNGKMTKVLKLESTSEQS